MDVQEGTPDNGCGQLLREVREVGRFNRPG